MAGRVAVALAVGLGVGVWVGLGVGFPVALGVEILDANRYVCKLVKEGKPLIAHEAARGTGNHNFHYCKSAEAVHYCKSDVGDRNAQGQGVGNDKNNETRYLLISKVRG